MDELKWCPFCGKTPLLRKQSQSYLAYGAFRVEFVQFWVECIHEFCGSRSQKYNKDEHAIEAWNKRI